MPYRVAILRDFPKLYNNKMTTLRYDVSDEQRRVMNALLSAAECLRSYWLDWGLPLRKSMRRARRRAGFNVSTWGFPAQQRRPIARRTAIAGDATTRLSTCRFIGVAICRFSSASVFILKFQSRPMLRSDEHIYYYEHNIYYKNLIFFKLAGRWRWFCFKCI